MLASLRDLHERVQVYTGAFELPEPDEKLLGMAKRIVEQEMRNVSLR